MDMDLDDLPEIDAYLQDLFGTPSTACPAETTISAGESAAPTPAPATTATPSTQPTLPPIGLPSVIPESILSPRQLKERYGLTQGMVPMQLVAAIEDFGVWSKTSINLERDLRYAQAVQTTTFDKQELHIYAFLGYAVKYGGRHAPNVVLTDYQDPELIISFVSYLMARGVGCGHVMKHLSIARKVVAYLQSRGSISTISQHLDAWLGVLEVQVGMVMPASRKCDLPALEDIFEWARDVAKQALQAARDEIEQLGHMTRPVAIMVQWAAIAVLLTGIEAPPIRVHIVKSALHPAYVAKVPCIDPDCRGGSRCLGNHFELDYSTGDAADKPNVKLHAPHHKNDRRGFQPISMAYPRGMLGDLLHLHVTAGHSLITQGTPAKQVCSFWGD